MPLKSAGKGKKKNGKGKKSRKSSSKSGGTGDQGPTPEQRHKLFQEKLNSWLRANCAQLIDTFSVYDHKGCGMVSKEEFTEGLTAMKAPISKEELQLIIKFITEKPARSKLDYLAFAKGAEIPFPIREDMSCEDIKLNVKGEANPKCGKCQLRFPPTQCPEVRPRYICLALELLQFVDRDIPCNFTTRVTASLTVFGVKRLVQDRFGHSLIDLMVYMEKRGISEPLSNSVTLSEVGFQGNTEDAPEQVSLFYDVHVDVHVNIDVTHAFYACPLLLTDHYFSKHAVSTPHTSPPIGSS